MPKTITLSLPDFHNWKTTSAGWITGAGIIMANKAAFLAPHPDKTHCAAILLVAVASAAIGTFSHDAGTPSKSTLDVVADMISASQPSANIAIDPTARDGQQ